MSAQNVLVPYEGLPAEGVKYSKMHLSRLEKAGRFPKRVHVSTRRIAWLQHEIRAFVADRVEQRDAAAA